MARKTQTTTSILNAELLRIGAALTTARGLVEALPDAQPKKALLDALAEAERGRAGAFDRLCFIMVTLSTL